MFNNKKARIFATIIIIVLVLAMVAPLLAYMFN